MPREQLTHAETTWLAQGLPTEPDSVDPVTSENGIGVESPILHVNWTKNQNSPDGNEIVPGYVQVSMQVDMKQIQEFMASDIEGIVCHWFYTPGLDRETINRMIRLLRHARDSAYGSDE